MIKILSPQDLHKTGVCSDFACCENILWKELLKSHPMPEVGVLANLRLISRRLQWFRDTIFDKHPIIITSAYRPGDYNREIGGAPNSLHTIGKAIDFQVAGFSPQKVQSLLKDYNGGLGAYHDFTHIDSGAKRRW